MQLHRSLYHYESDTTKKFSFSQAEADERNVSLIVRTISKANQVIQ